MGRAERYKVIFNAPRHFETLRSGACATEAGIAAQCAAIAEKAVAAASDLTEGQTATKNGARGREAAARWGVAGHAIYPLRYQVPHNTALLHKALEKIQVSMGKVATGGYHGTRTGTRLQPRAEGGNGHMHIRRHLEAAWHKQGLEVICSADARPWKNYYAYYVRRHMPALGIGGQVFHELPSLDVVGR